VRKNLSLLFLLLAVTAAALNLRTGIASLGPVLDDVLDAFGASGSLAGAITAMPGVFFGIMGLAAVPLATRIGLSRALFGGMLLTLLGLAVRPWVGDVAVFLVLTACVVGGIALGNVLLPAWIKSHGGRHAVVLMTLYSAGLGASGALGPLSAMWFSGEDAWKWALFIWVFLAVAQVLVWAFVVPRTGLDIPGAGPTSATEEDAETARRLRETSLWRSPTARFLMLFFGLQAMNAYIQMGWLPKIYTDNGVSSSTASIGLSVIGALNIVGGLLMPGIIARVTDLRPFPAVFAALTGLGYVGLWLAPSTVPLLWAVLLGIGPSTFPLALTLINLRTRTPAGSAALSGFMQGVGYAFSCLGPFLFGWLHAISGAWYLPFGFLLVCAVVLLSASWVACKPQKLEDVW